MPDFNKDLRFKEIREHKKEYLLNKEFESSQESEDKMYFSIMISLLTISTDFQTAYVKINEIQAIEMTDIMDEGGILTIYLKERVDSLVFQCHSDKGWDNAKKWLDDNMLNLSMEMKKVDSIQSEKNKARF